MQVGLFGGWFCVCVVGISIVCVCVVVVLLWCVCVFVVWEIVCVGQLCDVVEIWKDCCDVYVDIGEFLLDCCELCVWYDDVDEVVGEICMFVEWYEVFGVGVVVVNCELVVLCGDLWYYVMWLEYFGVCNFQWGVLFGGGCDVVGVVCEVLYYVVVVCFVCVFDCELQCGECVVGLVEQLCVYFVLLCECELVVCIEVLFGFEVWQCVLCEFVEYLCFDVG